MSEDRYTLGDDEYWPDRAGRLACHVEHLVELDDQADRMPAAALRARLRFFADLARPYVRDSAGRPA